MNISKRKFLLIFGFIILISLILVGWFFLFPLLSAGDAFVKITTKGTVSEVFLNNKWVGETPYLGEKLELGDKNLKLIGEMAGEKITFSTNLRLFSRAVTAVNYEFGPNNLFSSGDIRSFRKGNGLSIITTPKGSNITLDGEGVGKSPAVLTPNGGVHKLKISHTGFVTRELEVNIEENLTLVLEIFLAATPVDNPKEIETGKINIYRLSTSNEGLIRDYESWAEGVFFFEQEVGYGFDTLIDPSGKTYYKDKVSWDKKIANGKEITIGYLENAEETRISEAAASTIAKIKKAYSTLEEIKKPKIEIASTPTGTLNVRGGPGISHPILKKVKPGEKYELLDEETGWYKINASGTSGWISSQYAKKL